MTGENVDSDDPRPAADPAFGEDDGLTSKQGQAVEALLREPTATKAAMAVGINERTLRRWMAAPVFRNALLRARRDAFGQAIGLTHRYAPVAVATLVKVMNDPGAAASAKVTAAAVLLKFGREGIELDDLASRIDQLEQANRVFRLIDCDVRYSATDLEDEASDRRTRDE